MILFSVVTAALVFIALIFLLPPLLGKSRHKALEKQTAEARQALQEADDDERKRIAESLLASLEAEQNAPPAVSKSGALIVGLAVPLLALGMYAWLGSPALIDGTPQNQTTARHGASGMTMAEAIAQLEQRLQENPDNAEGWYMLARSYIAEQRYDKAVGAMERVIALAGEDDPNLLLQYADALAMANDGQVAGKPAEVVHKALALKPDFPEALWLAGIAESQNDNIGKAITYWRKAVPLLASQPESQAELKKQIAIAEEKLAEMGGSVPESVETAPPAEPATGATIRVTIDIAPELAAKVSPDDAVFVFARAASGPPMPLAATRTTVGALPATVTLSDEQAMMPQMKLSDFPQIVVGARISASGQAIPQPGDLEGSRGPLDTSGTKEISITIDSIR